MSAATFLSPGKRPNMHSIVPIIALDARLYSMDCEALASQPLESKSGLTQWIVE
jgi:hypothetical protein